MEGGGAEVHGEGISLCKYYPKPVGQWLGLGNSLALLIILMREYSSSKWDLPMCTT